MLITETDGVIVYDDHMEGINDLQMSSMRERVGGESEGSPETMPELSSIPMGYTLPVDAPERSETSRGSVYFIETSDRKFVKIGYSNDPARRLISIRIAIPGVRIAGWIPGSFRTEKWLHAKFSKYREAGEWFRLTPEIEAFMWNIGLIRDFENEPTRKDIEDSMRDRVKWVCHDCGVAGYTDKLSPNGSIPTFLHSASWRHKEKSPYCTGYGISIVVDEETLNNIGRLEIRRTEL